MLMAALRSATQALRFRACDIEFAVTRTSSLGNVYERHDDH